MCGQLLHLGTFLLSAHRVQQAPNVRRQDLHLQSEYTDGIVLLAMHLLHSQNLLHSFYINTRHSVNGDEGHDLSTEFYENNARLFLDGGGAEHATGYDRSTPAGNGSLGADHSVLNVWNKCKNFLKQKIWAVDGPANTTMLEKFDWHIKWARWKKKKLAKLVGAN